jgi:hypothetical protein
MEWVRERDLLIAQTMAFVRSVADQSRGDKGLDSNKLDSNKPDAKHRDDEERGPEPEARIEAAAIDAIEIVEPPPGIPFNIEAVRTGRSGDFRAEIQTRVANFRAHQQRFLREREEYCVATLAKVGVATGNDSTRPSPGSYNPRIEPRRS